MSRTVTTACTLLLAALFAAGGVGAAEYPLKRVVPRAGERRAWPVEAVPVDFDLQPPPGTWKLPAPRCAAPLYARLRLGDGERLLMVDTLAGGSPFYDRLYFDRDGDGDLTDDPPVALCPRSPFGLYRYVFLLEEVPVKEKDASRPYDFALAVKLRGRRRIPTKDSAKRILSLVLIPGTWYESEVEFAGKRLRLLLGDGNGNGRFGDPPELPDLSSLRPESSFPVEGDQLLVDEGGRPEAALFQPFGAYFVTEGRTYRLSPDPGRGVLEVTEVSDGLGEVELSMEVERMTLCRTGGAPLGAALFRPGRSFPIPPGSYRFVAYRALRAEPEGGLWAVTAEARKKTPLLSVKAGGRTVYSLGEPYSAFAVVPGWSVRNVRKGRGGASLDFVLEGAAGERVTGLALLKGKSAVPLSGKKPDHPEEPCFKVMDERGKLVVEGRFHYG